MAKHEIFSPEGGLEKLVVKILALVAQTPILSRDEEHKTRCLRRAELNFLWAQNAINQLSTMMCFLE